MHTTTHPLVIIGSGPAGLTAAIYASRANLAPLLIEGSAPGGQLMGTTAIENWPGSLSIMGPKLMMDMREHARHFGTQFVEGEVVSADFSQKPFQLTLSSGKTMVAHCVIIATGAVPNKLGCPGEAELWGKGVTTCAVCDGAFYRDRTVMVVGGGDTAMEDASFLKRFTNKITIVQNLPQLSASHAMQQRVLHDPDIKIIYGSTVSAIHGNGSHVTGATIKNLSSAAEQQVEVDGIFIAIGLKPNTKPFSGQLSLDKWGYILMNHQTHTSIPGVFAAGDVHDMRYKQAITSAASGCMAALDAERYLKELEEK